MYMKCRVSCSVESFIVEKCDKVKTLVRRKRKSLRKQLELTINLRRGKLLDPLDPMCDSSQLVAVVDPEIRRSMN